MTSGAPMSAARLPTDPPDFSVVQGGPLFQLWRRTHLTDDALQLLHRRILAFSLISWLPLLALAAIDGTLLGGGLTIPFLLDVEVHVRFLAVVPLLLAAELVAHRHMRWVPKCFLDRHLVPDGAMARFDAALASAVRLRNSLTAEVLLIAIVYAVGVLVVWRQYVAIDAATWYATASADGSKLSLAGMWYGYVSLPIFQFLLCRWYFRIFVWARFLWQVSRIRLSLIPTHPDRVGGLGFLAETVYSFVPLAAAHGALLSGQLADRIFYLGAALPDYKVEIAAMVVLVLCLALGPLLVFARQLYATNVAGVIEYGTLAQRYVREFDAKWVRGGAPPDEPLVGSADIQSLADLGNSLEVVRTMSFAPFTRYNAIEVAAATLIPIVPLLLTMMPLAELLKRLAGLLF